VGHDDHRRRPQKTGGDPVVNRVPYKFEFIGKKNIKNIDTPIRVYRVAEPSQATSRRPKRPARKVASAWRASFVALAVLVVLAGTSGWYYVIYRPKQAPAFAETPFIAVLPFANLSGDPRQDYFSDGMSEELINALARLEGLKVISRTSAFFFKGKDVDLQTIGAKLGVAHVLEGSVRKSGDHLRVTAQLVRVADDTHLWSDSYDRKLQEVFVVQDEIARAVVGELKVKLLAQKQTPLVDAPTQNLEAYNYYLRGCHFYLTDGKQSLACLEKAVGLDPGFAPAYAKIAGHHAWAHMLGGAVSREEAYPKAIAAVQKALALNDKLSDAHAYLGVIQTHHEWNWRAAEQCYKKAIKLNPGSVEAHSSYAQLLYITGRIDDALLESKTALGVDPLSIRASVEVGSSLLYARKYDQAIAQLKHHLEIWPKHVYARLQLWEAYAAKGMLEEAMAVSQQGIHYYPQVAFFAGSLAFVYGLAGKTDQAHAILNQLFEAAKTRYVPAMPFAMIYIGLGDRDKAFAYLEKAYATRETSGFLLLKVRPSLDSLRSDPRFDALLQKMGLAEF
jgi:serine/threonine-protein kinase